MAYTNKTFYSVIANFYKTSETTIVFSFVKLVNAGS